ncbi:MAG: hypothetical protein WBM83_09520 [Flavobacteriaceae bacterium]
MNKILFYILLVLAFLSCNQTKENGVVEDALVVTISTEKWPKKANVEPGAQFVLKEWAEYNALDTSFDLLYTVENREDLILVIEDLIEKQKALEGSVYPELFDTPQIKSRQKVFKTFFLKVKGNLEYRLDLEEPVLETIKAYSDLREQFNSTVNNTLDINLILEEE